MSMYTKKYGIRNLRMALGQKYNVCFEPFFPGWLQVTANAEDMDTVGMMDADELVFNLCVIAKTIKYDVPLMEIENWFDLFSTIGLQVVVYLSPDNRAVLATSAAQEMIDNEWLDYEDGERVATNSVENMITIANSPEDYHYGTEINGSWWNAGYKHLCFAYSDGSCLVITPFTDEFIDRVKAYSWVEYKAAFKANLA